MLQCIMSKKTDWTVLLLQVSTASIFSLIAFFFLPRADMKEKLEALKWNKMKKAAGCFLLLQRLNTVDDDTRIFLL